MVIEELAGPVEPVPRSCAQVRHAVAIEGDADGQWRLRRQRLGPEEAPDARATLAEPCHQAVEVWMVAAVAPEREEPELKIDPGLMGATIVGARWRLPGL